jgi:signal transduction histidine kinase
MHLEDISHEKRKAVLENVFFHDVLNRLGGLTGIISLIKNGNKQPELDEYLGMLETIGDIVVEDIQNQQYLKSAEADNLLVNIRENRASEILESVRRQIMFHPVARNLEVEVHFESGDFSLQTDGALLKRILLNMAKNAAEATAENENIVLTTRLEENTCTFAVNNPGIIPEDIQLQIFQRSFTTKGLGRGLGTYSMKLFGENYLKGRVSFTSNFETGTTFKIEIPVAY